jgi:hypothetical protein
MRVYSKLPGSNTPVRTLVFLTIVSATSGFKQSAQRRKRGFLYWDPTSLHALLDSISSVSIIYPISQQYAKSCAIKSRFCKRVAFLVTF